MDTFTLEKLQIGFMQNISPYLLDADVNISERIGHNIECQIRGFIWADEAKRYVFKYPADWKEAFKERWFPKWAKRKWPVVYKNHEITARNIYPELKLSIPKETHTVVLSSLMWKDK